MKAPRPSLVVIAALAGLTACTPAPAPQGINDPDEAANREVHALNLAIDTAVLRPVASAVRSEGPPGPLARVIGNFADNLDEPRRVVNSLLQLRIANAGENALRFVVNTTFGLGGVLDPAGALGLNGKDTDFGETLHVWGVGEGTYVELPVFGPSTSRDAFGMAVDYAINPVRILLDPPESYVATAAGAASRIGDRGRYSNTVDSILYDSADSYAQARLLYLQNRRFQLGQTGGDDAAFEDPYEDPYAQ